MASERSNIRVKRHSVGFDIYETPTTDAGKMKTITADSLATILFGEGKNKRGEGCIGHDETKLRNG